MKHKDKFILSTEGDKFKINRSLNDIKIIIFIPDRIKGLEVHVGASFSRNWNSLYSTEATLVLARTGFVVKKIRCPLLRASGLQSEIFLSTTDAKSTALSHSMRQTLTLMGVGKIKLWRVRLC